MHDKPLIRSAQVRLVADASAGSPARARLYRPLVVGPAILHRRSGSSGPWRVELSCDRSFLPRAPRSAALLRRTLARLGDRGLVCRVGAAVVRPQDITWHDISLLRHSDRPSLPRSGRFIRSEIYGWALMYQPPGMRGGAFVDADERFAELPACFELPEELLDRAAHLEDHGFRTRPVAMVTRPEDFTRTDDGRWRNRFRRRARFRRSCGLERLV